MQSDRYPGYNPHELLTPPLTPASPFTQSDCTSSAIGTRTTNGMGVVDSANASPDFRLPPPMSVPELDLDDVGGGRAGVAHGEKGDGRWEDDGEEKYRWREDMTGEEREAREAWLASGRGKKGLRIVIVTENFLPKVDGVTRTLSRLLEHLHASGHQCMLLGPSSSLSSYASHPLVGTLGIPLILYPGLKLNFVRPKFLRVIREWKPDVVHFVDPIWLGAQTMGLEGRWWLVIIRVSHFHGVDERQELTRGRNLATYATLFGLPSLTPLIYKFQHLLYSKVLLTLCPSPSTQKMLEDQSFDGVRLWPRGVDLAQFGTGKRSLKRRAEWGVGYAPGERDTPGVGLGKGRVVGTGWNGQEGKGLMTPPMSPEDGAVDAKRGVPLPEPEMSAGVEGLPERVVLLYVGRISWEKNIHLLLSAYAHLASLLPSQSPFPSPLPKLVFVGDGPARSELQATCAKNAWDAEFLGYRQGEDLAECYASADVFAFPSFTETFGQVVLEALASGIPVVGLDAEGTRDLVQHSSTGFLLPLNPSPAAPTAQPLTWPTASNPSSPHFNHLAEEYAKLLLEAATDHGKRREMGRVGSTRGIEGRTWWDAMESCVDGYREAMRIARQRRSINIVTSPPPPVELEALVPPASPKHPKRVSAVVNRVVSRRLAYKDQDRQGLERKGRWVLRKREGESLWLSVLKVLLKVFVALALVYAIYVNRMGKETYLQAEGGLLY
ncbi:hypothetical protein L202_05129 [Cryptococcus amylolentus CBS 6039]|uniref:Glycosyltransferase subfamily 4-like N-terminal domain-containing protein n=1 Tax=Cryptococcus amylolentus CBS 6039 TaxID=1295533 RepID=A0A1E3HNY8_9TREE|nr:hypothetical protein L202_05129 [Cryptococcus amylolentus CBS 6039]ODN78047.1 hypothetical protein L202_05129 [Cryptococcus amylolentus CBS 6039]